MDLYVEELTDFEDELKASQAHEALLCMLAKERDVAMMLIDRDGSIHRNDHALEKLQAMWKHSFDVNIKTLVPIFAERIRQNELAVAGIKWLPHEPS